MLFGWGGGTYSGGGRVPVPGLDGGRPTLVRGGTRLRSGWGEYLLWWGGGTHLRSGWGGTYSGRGIPTLVGGTPAGGYPGGVAPPHQLYAVPPISWMGYPPSAGWGTPQSAGQGIPHQLDGVPPHHQLDRVPPPPIHQTENITFPHPSDAGGKKYHVVSDHTN